ncbi:MAG: alanyl-tRNA editing protein [Candidatus Woesearchaeota archaeon]|nr:alanyl-tRNA editing protein [Candidatus Woesearchaeota archaeon]
MTQKIFWEDPYQVECTAKVTSIEGKKVKLDKTIFFAFCGGQESDSGTIDGINVVTATKLGDKENIIDIEYELEKEPHFAVGDEVKVVIDKEKRLSLMKLHSAAHISYYFTIEKFGKMRILGSNIAPQKARVDYESEKNLGEGLEEVEKKLNDFLAEGHDILRTADEKLPDLKWWQCEGWKMPCGGTHVRNTREIGRVRLRRITKGQSKERIEIHLE